VPVFNAATFLESALQSILTQDYRNLEVIVVDGGSTDGSLDIIRRHAKGLYWWCSEPDGGQYDAINKGFAHSSGEVMAWLNADDGYFPWALKTVGSIFASLPQVHWLTSLRPSTMTEDGQLVAVGRPDGFARRFFRRGTYMRTGLPHQRGYIQQESTFWRRSLWEVAGGRLAPEWELAGDFELWNRLFQHAELAGVRVPLAAFRYHAAQRSQVHARCYHDQARAILHALGGTLPGAVLSRFLSWRPGRVWPLSILPRLGLIQPVPEAEWDWQSGRWKLVRRWICS
jgi:glycosyltransferase involved in cell wall biosynthesis